MKRETRKTPAKREAKKAKRKAPTEPDRVLHDSLYGDIPLIPVQSVYVDGTPAPYIQWLPDPAYQPPLPPGAVRGDPSKQDYYSYYVPHYFYMDEQKVCVQCGEAFMFTGREQKYWYETMRFNFSSVAIRCRKCRRQRRTGVALHRQLEAAIRLTEEQPKDPGALVTLARATAEFAAHFANGNIDRGIGAAHRALRLDPMLHEAQYWEARCQEAAGRKDKARGLYETFIEALHKDKRYRTLVNEAKERVALLKAGNVQEGGDATTLG